MAVKSDVVSVTTTATKLTAGAGDEFGGRAGCGRNMGSEPLYIGGADVTVANGFPVDPGQSTPGWSGLGQGEHVYGICATGPLPVRVFEVGE